MAGIDDAAEVVTGDWPRFYQMGMTKPGEARSRDGFRVDPTQWRHGSPIVCFRTFVEAVLRCLRDAKSAAQGLNLDLRFAGTAER